MYDMSVHTGSSEAVSQGLARRRSRKSNVRRKPRKNGRNGSAGSESPNGGAAGEENEVDDVRRRQEKIDSRRELLKRHQEEVKWQAVDKILNEKSRQEREKEKKLKKELIDSKTREAALEEKKRQALTNIHIKYYKDGLVTLSFPRGFLLPKVLAQDGVQDSVQSRPTATSSVCAHCGKPSKYRDPHTDRRSCSLECYKALQQ